MADSRYVLMHKNTPVADLQLDTDTGVIRSVGHVYNALHVPVGIPVKKGVIDRSALNTWWTGRAIPASRDRIRDALRELELASTQLLLDKCLGLSLSDQYWICPTSSGVRWEEVNFFQNAFSDDVGNILLGRGSSSGRVSLMSPDNTSDGWLKKKWAILDERRCLMKGGSGATQQEPYNEVLASSVMERLGIPHVTYTLTVQEDYPYSVCEDFITPETELIPAWYIMQTVKRPNHVSVYQHYMDCCEALGIPGVREAVDRMIVLDYLIVNEDRHQNNFGVVRNAETLEYLGAAPIYDSGTSLWFDKPTGMVVECQQERSQFQNRDRAMRILASRLYEAEQEKRSSEFTAERRSQVGTGMRNERIRTYNFPQGRVTDHRIGLTLYKIESVMDGDLDELMDALAAADQAERLKQTQ